jgi:hypothetical protein
VYAEGQRVAPLRLAAYSRLRAYRLRLPSIPQGVPDLTIPAVSGKLRPTGLGISGSLTACESGQWAASGCGPRATPADLAVGRRALLRGFQGISIRRQRDAPALGWLMPELRKRMLSLTRNSLWSQRLESAREAVIF